MVYLEAKIFFNDSSVVKNLGFCIAINQRFPQKLFCLVSNLLSITISFFCHC
eukprot:UN10444